MNDRSANSPQRPTHAEALAELEVLHFKMMVLTEVTFVITRSPDISETVMRNIIRMLDERDSFWIRRRVFKVNEWIAEAINYRRKPHERIVKESTEPNQT